MATLAIWRDGAADGPTNMAADEVLAAEARHRGAPLVRLYQWESPTVSLGAFQAIAAARALCGHAGTALVRRPSGGGAIVHGTDLTYALAIPAGHPWSLSAEPLYRAVHEPLVAELVSLGLAARLHERSTDGVSGLAAPFFCFSRRSPGDLVVDPPAPAGDGPGTSRTDAKVLGGAQRRLAGAVVQHGSLLMRANNGVPPAWRHAGLRDLGAETGDDGLAVAVAWMTRVAASLGLEPAWQDGPFATHDRWRAAVAEQSRRYHETRWLERR